MPISTWRGITFASRGRAKRPLCTNVNKAAYRVGPPVNWRSCRIRIKKYTRTLVKCVIVTEFRLFPNFSHHTCTLFNWVSQINGLGICLLRWDEIRIWTCFCHVVCGQTTNSDTKFKEKYLLEPDPKLAIVCTRWFHAARFCVPPKVTSQSLWWTLLREHLIGSKRPLQRRRFHLPDIVPRAILVRDRKKSWVIESLAVLTVSLSLFWFWTFKKLRDKKWVKKERVPFFSGWQHFYQRGAASFEMDADLCWPTHKSN